MPRIYIMYPTQYHTHPHILYWTLPLKIYIKYKVIAKKIDRINNPPSILIYLQRNTNDLIQNQK